MSTQSTSGSFLTLSGNNTTHTGTLGSYTVTGGSFYTSDSALADNQAFGQSLNGATFLAVGPGSQSTTSTIAFGSAGIGFISFLWGSPDTYNTLTVTTTGGSQTAYSFTPGTANAQGLTFMSSTGSQSYAQYVGFTASAGERITSLTFSSTQDAFEAANFSVTAPVPEPETYALMLGGLGLVGFLARRRKAV